MTTQLTEVAEKVLKRRYLVKDDNGNVIETPDLRFQRVAEYVAEAERQYGGDPSAYAPIFRSMIAKGDFVPNTPCVANAGRPNGSGQLSACFVIPVPDDMAGIFEALKQQALIHKTGGGTGMSFSRIRPKGDFVATTSGIASGPVSFMRLFNAATEEVKQGGIRRGANMGILRVDHPDIEEFISCKADVSQIKNFNISVAITDAFMAALEAGTDYDLINPATGMVTGRLSAEEIWHKIVRQAHATGEPGLFFIDRVNHLDPLSDALGPIEATNPCVTGDTLILTRYGQTPIETVVGEPVDVWNGQSWATVRPRITGTDQPVVRVELSDGHSLRCTPYHVFYLADGTKVEAENLEPGDVLQKIGYTPPMEGGRPPDFDPYLAGFFQGDGHVNRGSGKKEINFYGDEKLKIADILRYEGLISLQPYSTAQDRARGVLTRETLEKGEVPLQWDRASSLEFVAGLLDSDGNVVFSDKRRQSYGYQVSSINRSFLVNVAHLLRQLGVPSTVARSHRATTKEMPGGEYECQECFRLNIPPGAVNRLFEIGLRPRRLYSGANQPQRDALRFPRVVSVVPDGRADRVYCFTEPEQGKGVFSSILTGQCGEVPLRGHDACTLGSINVSNFYVEKSSTPNDITKYGTLDFDRLRETVHHAVRFLDNVLTVNQYPVEDIYKVTDESRKIGLGVMGWADLLCKLGIPYASDDAVRFGGELMAFINKHAVKASEDLASHRGAFPAWHESKWAKKTQTPRRNSTVTVIAPTGSISIIAGCSAGIEPLFALCQTRNQAEMRMVDFSRVFREVAERERFWSEALARRVAERGTVQNDPDVPEKWQEVFQIAGEIDPPWHIEHQAAFQENTEDAVSKTINLPEDAPPADVERAYLQAWKSGCKGITVYRDNCRPDQTLSVGTKTKEKIDVPKRRHIPANGRRPGETITKKTPLGSAHVNITTHPDDGEPFEIFAAMGKPGTEVRALSEALGRVASLALKVSPTPRQTLVEMADQLAGIAGSDICRNGQEVIVSAPDGIAHAIKDFFSGGETPSDKASAKGDICPDCGSGNLYRAEGCATCQQCGFSRC